MLIRTHSPEIIQTLNYQAFLPKWSLQQLNSIHENEADLGTKYLVLTRLKLAVWSAASIGISDDRTKPSTIGSNDRISENKFF